MNWLYREVNDQSQRKRSIVQWRMRAAGVRAVRVLAITNAAFMTL